MWILRYRYDLEDGTARNVSCCLQEGQTYSIGRSSKNMLNIKNDKSISRNHISLTWQREKHQIVLNNQGKLTAAGGKYLKVGEEMIFEEFIYKVKIILVELGTKPIKVEVLWKDVIWEVPRQFATLKGELSPFGIDVQVETAYVRSTVMIVDQNEAHRTLFGLVHNIPLRTPQFLHDSMKVLSSSEAVFDESWNKLETGQPPILTLDKDVQEQVFGGLKFYSVKVEGQVLSYLKQAVEKAGGQFVAVENLQELVNLLKSESSVDHVVVIGAANSKVDLCKAGITSFTPDDIVESVQNDNIEKLLRGVPQLTHSLPRSQASNTSWGSFDDKKETKTLRPSVDEPDQNSEKPPAKRRRLNRRTVKPLDSLMFFAGGDSFKRESGSDIPPVESLKERTLLPIPELHTETNLETKAIIPQTSPEIVEELSTAHEESALEHSNGTPVKGGQRSVSSNVVYPVSKDEVSRDDDHEGINKDSILHREPCHNSPIHDIGSMINTREAVRRRTLRGTDRNDLSQADGPKEDLVEVIKDVKNREVRRLNSTLIQVDSNELTEDAIHQLGNLAIVQSNESLLRGRQDKEVEQDANSHQPWYGRKNFKTFMKIQPKYKSHQLGDKYREGSADFIRNSAFLLTREYVPMKPYSGQSHSKTEDFPKVAREIPASSAAIDHCGEVHLQEKSTSTRHSSVPSPAQELFVVDEDDSQTTAPMQPERRVAPDLDFKAADVVSSHHDIDSAILGKRKADRGRSHLNMINDDDDGNDDDDDDDDEPKFKFRRRMR